MNGGTEEVKEFSVRALLAGEEAGTLLGGLLDSDANALLTATWIAEAHKAHAQAMMMEVDRHTLWPMVRQLMSALMDVVVDDGARIWAGTALALLEEREGTGEIGERVGQASLDPAATPRGHYMEGMHGQFRGLQFLIKSVFDVDLDPLWCRATRHFVFPRSSLNVILEALRTHPQLRWQWDDLHRFYTVATGEPDCVAISHLLDQPVVEPGTVVALALELSLPQIHRKMGIGVQGLTERFTHHGLVFERLKETILPDVSRVPVPRDSVYAVVNMRSLFYGFEHPVGGERLPVVLKGQVAGLLDALSFRRRRPGQSFFDRFLMAQHELVADLPVPDVSYLVPDLDPAVERLSPLTRRRVNVFAADLTSLLELSILSARQPMKVGSLSLPSPPTARICVERASRRFFEGLPQAAQTLADLCQEMIWAYGRQPAGGDESPADRAGPLIDLDVIARVLTDRSEGGGFVLKGSEEWIAVAPLVESLTRNPSVTADAYRHVGPAGQYSLQLCTAMASFRARMADGVPVEGGELLFVEGWNDTLVPERDRPLTNPA